MLELASAGQFDGQGDHHSPKPNVRKAFAKYLECGPSTWLRTGIFAHGFARARCGDCGHDHLLAFSCKGRGVCPSCTTRLRYYMQRDGPVLGMVLRIFHPASAIDASAVAQVQDTLRWNSSTASRHWWTCRRTRFMSG